MVYGIPSEIKFLTITTPYGTCLVSCNCTNSEYLNHHGGYIITGYLLIIENKESRKIISKGAHNRERKTHHARLGQSD